MIDIIGNKGSGIGGSIQQLIWFDDGTDIKKILPARNVDISGANVFTNNVLSATGNLGIEIIDSGYVGIGTDTPTEKLDVDGNIRLTGGFTDTDVTTAINLGDPVNTSLNTFNKTVLGSINELKGLMNAWPSEANRLTDFYLNSPETQTLTTTGATDLQTKIDSLIDGDILEIQVDAVYSPIVIPAAKRFAVRVKEGYDVEINGAQGITLNNGAANIFISGIICDSNPGGTHSQGSAVCFQWQAIVSKIIFHNITCRNNDHGAVVLSYHQSTGGDTYYTANLLTEFSEKVAFIDCHFHKASNDSVETGSITARGIDFLYLKNCKIDAQSLSRCIHIQNNFNYIVDECEVINGFGSGNGEGIKIDRAGSPAYFNNGVVIRCRVANCIEGIDIDDTVNAFVIDNVVSGCSAEGISLDDSSTGVMIGNISYNNYDGIRAELGSVINLKYNFAFNNSNVDYRMDNSYVPDDSNSTLIIDTMLGADKIPFIHTGGNLYSTLVNNAIDEVDDKFYSALQHPTGFPTIVDSEILYNPAIQQITLQPKAPATEFYYYLKGVKYKVDSAQIKTHSATTGTYFLYFDSANVLQFSASPWNLTTDMPISYVVYNQTQVDGFSNEDRHGSKRNPAAHQELHDRIGTYIVDGFAISGYTLQPASPVDADNTFAIASGTIADEDLRVALGALADDGPYSVFYRLGATGEWRWDKTKTLPFFSGTYIQYNQFTGSTWQLTELATNNYINMYVFKVPASSGVFQTVIAPGQNVYTTLAGANGESVSELQWGIMPFQEIAPLYKITFVTSAAYASTGKARIENVVKLEGTRVSITAAAQANHNALTGLQLSDDGITWGHIDDQPQTIYGDKTFADNLIVDGKLTVTGIIDPTALILDPQASAPSTDDGAIYYDSVSTEFKFRENGAWKSFTSYDTFLELTDTPSAYNAGRILFESAAGISDNFGLIWDNINARLGVRQVTPLVELHIGPGLTGNGNIILERTTLAFESLLRFQTASNYSWYIGSNDGDTTFDIYNYNTSSKVFTIDDVTGNIGIGVDTPAFTFDILSSVSGGNFRVKSTSGIGNSTCELVVDTTDANDQSMLEFAGAGVGKWKLFSSNTHSSPNDRLGIRKAGGSEYFTILDNGNIGIGTTNPQAEMHIFSTSTPTLILEADTSAEEAGRIRLKGGSEYFDLAFYAQDSIEQFRIESHVGGTGTPWLSMGTTGKIGINKTSIVERLSVAELGVLKGNKDILSIENTANSTNMADTKTSIRFDQTYYDATTPASVPAGRIVIGADGNWTSALSTHYAYMAFETATNGVMTEHARFNSVGNFAIGLSAFSSYKLHVAGNLKIDHSGATETAIFKNSDDNLDIDFDCGSGKNVLFNFLKNGSPKNSFTVDSANSMIFNSEFTSNMLVMKSSGAIGMAVTDPVEKLEVGGNIKLSGYIGLDADNNFQHVAANGMLLNSSNNFYINIDSDSTTPAVAYFVVAKDRNGVAGGTELLKVFENGNTALYGKLAIGAGVTAYEFEVTGNSNMNGLLTQSGLTRRTTSESVDDDAEIIIATGTAGFGFVQAGDNEEYAKFTWKADGTVILLTDVTANVTNTDTDGNLCIYDAGTGIAIKNRLGAAKIIRFDLNYS